MLCCWNTAAIDNSACYLENHWKSLKSFSWNGWKQCAERTGTLQVDVKCHPCYRANYAFLKISLNVAWLLCHHYIVLKNVYNLFHFMQNSGSRICKLRGSEIQNWSGWQSNTGIEVNSMWYLLLCCLNVWVSQWLTPSAV